MKRSLLLMIIFVLLSMVGCSDFVSPTAPPTPTPTATHKTATPTPEPTPTPTPVSPPESFSKNKSQLVREGFSVVKDEDGWRITAKDEKDKEVEVATAVSEEKIAINVNGETKEFSQEAFVPMVLNGDTVYLLTIQENGKDIDYFYIKETGEWVTPIEVQTNPDNPENYTQIEREDVWNGRLKYSEMIVAKDFPEGTLIPDNYSYNTSRYPTGSITLLMHFIWADGEYDKVLRTYNDFKRWEFFYNVDVDGERYVIGTEQALSPDGKSSYFFHFAFGPQWGVSADSVPESLVIDVFKVKERGYKSPSLRIFPIINHDTDLCGDESYAMAPQMATCELYLPEMNKPEKIREDLMDLIKSWQEGSYDNTVADSEIEKLQNMLLVPRNFRFYYPDYWTE